MGNKLITYFPTYVAMATASSFLLGVIYNFGFFSPFNRSAISFVSFNDHIDTAVQFMPVAFFSFFFGAVLFVLFLQPHNDAPENEGKIRKKLQFFQTKSIIVLFLFLAFITTIYLPWSKAFILLQMMVTLSILACTFSCCLKKAAQKFLTPFLIIFIILGLFCYTYFQGKSNSFSIIMSEPLENVLSIEDKLINGIFFKSVTDGIYIIETGSLEFYSNSGKKLNLGKPPEIIKKTAACELLNICLIDKWKENDKTKDLSSSEYFLTNPQRI